MNDQSTLPAWAQSSADPTQISTFISSFGKVIGGVVVIVGTLYGVDPVLLHSQVGTFVAQWMTAAPAMYIAWQSAEMLFGLFRKAFIRSVVPSVSNVIPAIQAGVSAGLSPTGAPNGNALAIGSSTTE